jgi:hypothetical protein
MRLGVTIDVMTFAKRVFLVAGIYGVIVLLPQYFMEERIGRDFPPPINHPEHFYGFIGVALAWQVLFFVIARDPVRYRGAMPVAILEKLSFGIAAVVLYLQARIPVAVLVPGIIDLVLASLFFVAWWRTGREEVRGKKEEGRGKREGENGE